jgi:hypothetical protein
VRDEHRLIRAFARMLPRHFRERVFEPALADLRLEEHARGDARGGLTPRLLLILQCLRVALPLLVWRHNRPTRILTTLLLIAGVTAVVVQRAEYGKRIATARARR